MWANIKSLFSSTKTKAQQNLPDNFDQLVKHAITLIENNTTNIDTDKDFLNYLISNGIEYKAAVEILIFLPIAFVRHWLHTVKWSDIYIEYFIKIEACKKNIAKQQPIKLFGTSLTSILITSQKMKLFLR